MSLYGTRVPIRCEYIAYNCSCNVLRTLLIKEIIILIIVSMFYYESWSNYNIASATRPLRGLHLRHFHIRRSKFDMHAPLYHPGCMIVSYKAINS